MGAEVNEKLNVYQRGLRWLADFPIFYKLLIANTALALATGLVASWLALGHASDSKAHALHWEFAVWFTPVTALTILGVNWVLIRTALQPLSALSHLGGALQRRDMHARAKLTFFGDPAATSLIRSVNSLLDELEAYQRRLNDLSRRVTQQLEAERENVAKELHDDIAQNLAALLVLHQMIARASDDSVRASTVEEAQNLTRLTLEGVRGISAGLRPAVLDELGLAGALRWYVRELMAKVLPPVVLDLQQNMARLSPIEELSLYRIAQESLSNIIRHSQALEVRLSLSCENGEVVLRIMDNGTGFDPSSVSVNAREHLGLFTITERARLAGGTAEITSIPGKGTAVVARIPVKDSQPELGAHQ